MLQIIQKLFIGYIYIYYIKVAVCNDHQRIFCLLLYTRENYETAILGYHKRQEIVL